MPESGIRASPFSTSETLSSGRQAISKAASTPIYRTCSMVHPRASARSVWSGSFVGPATAPSIAAGILERYNLDLVVVTTGGVPDIVS